MKRPELTHGSDRRVQLFLGYLGDLPLDVWVRAATRRPHVPHMAEAERTLRGIVRCLHVYAPFEEVIPSTLLMGLPE